MFNTLTIQYTKMLKFVTIISSKQLSLKGKGQIQMSLAIMFWKCRYSYVANLILGTVIIDLYFTIC